jgi:hypothetical protein
VQTWLNLLEFYSVFHFWELIGRSPEAFINITTILRIVACVQHGLESWRHVILSTKLAAIICKLAHCQKYIVYTNGEGGSTYLTDQHSTELYNINQQNAHFLN